MKELEDLSLRQKRYGQFFSGNRVADLLVSLIPEKEKIKTVIDPMVGTGDMLEAVKNSEIRASRLWGIDIDPTVLPTCKKKVKEAKLVNSSAFDYYPAQFRSGWDLVITNPPYVRYQLLNGEDAFGLPDGEKIRQDLAGYIEHNPYISKKDKALFLSLTQNYSGLSDLSIPSWILCASLVRTGGYLAMVVPDTWLNRDYAMPIHYLLMKCFELQIIIKDTESSWFDNAQVKTCIILAKRRKTINLCMGENDETIYISMGKGVAGKNSLTQNLIFEEFSGKQAFDKILSSKLEMNNHDFALKIVNTRILFSNFLNDIDKVKWIQKEDKIVVKDRDKLPLEIQKIIEGYGESEYISIESLKWNIGQGLRTGANEFFYGNVISKEKTFVRVKTREWNNKTICVDNENIVYALQNRSEIDGHCVTEEKLSKCIFYLQKEIRKSDVELLSGKCENVYHIMKKELEEYIDEAEMYKPKNGKKPFPELSAVKTNIKKDDSGYTNFWYMLPKMKERHYPDICIPRINGDSVNSLFVMQAKNKNIVVDANFITMWSKDTDSHMEMFAITNSLWFKCYLELTSTVMGGGALKVEASHLKHMLLPKMTDEQRITMQQLGKRLLLKTNSKEIQSEIDNIMFSSFGINKDVVIDAFKELLAKKKKERGGTYEY